MGLGIGVSESFFFISGNCVVWHNFVKKKRKKIMYISYVTDGQTEGDKYDLTRFIVDKNWSPNSRGLR